MKQFYKLLAIGLIALMPSIVQGQTATAPTVGNGSVGSPYEIATLENLYWIAANSSRWSYHYKQTANINASATSTWFSGAGWTPIGNATVKFTGTYDGSGFTIDGLYMKRISTSHQALFGFTNGAIIKNVGITNVYANGAESTGGLIGANTSLSDIIENCFATGTVISAQTGYPYFAGGLIAFNMGSVSNCYSEVNVSARQYLGSFAGHNAGIITNSYSTGNLTVDGVNNTFAGAFLGKNNETGEVNNCYSTGNITRTSTNTYHHFGGFIGFNERGKVNSCYSTGKVIYVSIVQTDKGFCGVIDNTGSYEMTGNFWNVTTSEATSTFGDAVGIATAQMQTQSTFTDAGWNFNTIWVIGNANNSFPQLKTTETPLGEGTVANPYKIHTLDNLNWVSQNSTSWDKHFVQTADIDASATSKWFSGEGWAPIGSSGVSFSGNYDGQNHIISNLFINQPLVDNVGLFGITDGCTISNTHLNNVNITGRHATAAVVGLLGNWSNLTGCSSSGTVNGNINVGGLVGSTWDSNIYNSYSAANVNAVLNAGGLVGGHHNSEESGPDGGTIMNCYTTGSVLATGTSSRAGGITSITRKSYIKNSYATGTINSSGPKGGIVGVESYPGYTDNTNFWDTQTTGLSTSGGQAVGKTTADMKTAATFTSAGWDFTNLWGIGNINNGYPFFSASLEPQGDGTLENPYKIQTLANLYWLSQTPTHWDKHFVQTANIDASETSTWNSGAGWSPIGIYFYYDNPNQAPFTGKYNGGGYTISNLHINRPSQGERIGLFGWTQGATIENLSLSSLSITGENYVGGVVGYTDNTSITRCNVSGSVTMRQLVGGIAGYATNASNISYCTVSANITAKVTAGGIVGFNDASTISMCYSTGNISASTGEESYYYGGIAGLNRGEIRSCFSRSNVVSGMEKGGGLVGDNDMGGTISNSYSTGAISSLGGYYIGGLTGLNSGTVTNSFWDTQNSGMATSTAGIGKTTEEMKAYETFYNASWDFKGETANGVDDIWNIGNSTNDGYPYFNWTSPSDLAPQFVTFSDIAGKTYGDPSFELSASASSGLGVSFSSSDENVVSISGNTATIVGAGSVTIYANQAGNENYSPAQTKTKQITVAKAPLTIAAEDKSKSYDGSGFTAFTSTYSGFVNGEDETALTGTLTYTGTAATAVNGGTHTITPQGITSNNYEIDFVDGTLEISKVPLTITAENKTKTYDGSAFTAFTSTYSGFVNGEDASALSGTLTYTGTAATAVNAGTYTITPQGVTSDNYEITFADGSLEIGKAALTVTADSKAKTYDGSAFTAFTSTYSGFVNGEDATVLGGALTYTGDAVTATNAGTYTITPTGITSSNYEIAFVNGSLEIAKAPLSITAEDKSKSYDGSGFTAFTSTYSGFVNGEDETALTGTITYTGTAATAVNGGTHTITPQGITSNNYEIDFVDGTLEISKVPLTITAENKTKTYDGSAFTAFTSTFSGFVNGENEAVLGGTLTYAGDAATATNAGTYTITPTGVTSSNYEIAFANGSLEIGKAPLTVTADSKAKTYDGSAFTTFTSTFSGLVNGEDETALTGTLTYTGTAATAVNAGTYTITPQGVTSDNYEITFADGSLEIGKAALTVTADSKAKTYDGSAFTAFTSTFSGLVNGEDETALTGTLTYTGTAATAVNAGTYTITPQGVTSSNYEITFVNGSLEIGKAALTVTADDKAKTYDGSAFTTFTSTFSGFVNSEDASALSGTLTYTGTAATSINAGTYTITPQGVTSDNYEITFVNGSLEIGKVTLTVTADNKSKTYDGSAFTAFTSTFSGFVNGEDATVLGGALTYTGAATTATNAGTYTITPQGVTSDNYEITFVNSSLEIGKVTLTVTADNKSKTYDGSAFTAFTSTFSGFVNGEDATVLGGALTYTGAATTATNAGSYTITPQGVTSDNYEITFVNGSLEIGKVTLTVTADNKSKTYDGSAFTTFTSTFSGLVNGEDETALTGTLTYTGTAATAVNAGTYTITPQGVTSSNYEITFVNGSLEIGKAALTVTADDKAKTYDGSAFTTFTSTFSGFVNSEDASALSGTLAYTGAATTATNAGTYTITPQGVTSDNYEISFVNGSLEIGKAALTVTADDKAKTYDGSAFTAFTSTYSGFVNSEDATVLGGALTYTGAATTATNAGTYTITPQGFTSDNYEITFVNGSLEIGKAALIVTADNKTKNEGEENPMFTFTYSGFIGNDTANDIDEQPNVSTTATADSPAGEYPIILVGGVDNNYTFTLVNGTLTVKEITYAISFTVTSKESPVANAIIQINGMELTTDANGLASINLPNGSYTYTVTASGYVTHEDNITVSDAEKSVSINLSTVGIGTQNISHVQAYPNPFTNNLNIQSDEDIKLVQVMDITGKTACMYSNVNSSKLLIPTDQLKQGIYIIVIQTATHTKTLKVVKQ